MILHHHRHRHSCAWSEFVMSPTPQFYGKISWGEPPHNPRWHRVQAKPALQSERSGGHRRRPLQWPAGLSSVQTLWNHGGSAHNQWLWRQAKPALESKDSRCRHHSVSFFLTSTLALLYPWPLPTPMPKLESHCPHTIFKCPFSPFPLIYFLFLTYLFILLSPFSSLF